MADDDVQLSDLEVIQQYSLAVRTASAPRAEVIAALEADLAHLQGSRRRTAAAAPVEEPTKAPAKRAAPVKKATTTRARARG